MARAARREPRRDARLLRRALRVRRQRSPQTDQGYAQAYDHIDMPPIRPVTTRIDLHSGNCPCCKQRVAAKPPADMPQGTPFGPGIVALVTYLHGCQMVSYKRLTEVLDGLFGLTISQGAIANMLARVAEPFAAPASEIAETVRTSQVIASDETSARVKGKTCWQWTFGAATAVYSPDGADARQVRADRVPRRREAEGVAVGPAGRAVQARRGAPVLPRASDPRCAIRHRRRRHHLRARPSRRSSRTPARSAAAGPISPTPPSRRTRAVSSASSTACSHSSRPMPRAAISATHDLDCRDKLLVFLKRRDVEPTNNDSERALQRLGDLPQSDERLPLRLGRQGLRRHLLHCRNRPPHGRSALTAIRDALARRYAAGSILITGW